MAVVEGEPTCKVLELTPDKIRDGMLDIFDPQRQDPEMDFQIEREVRFGLPRTRMDSAAFIMSLTVRARLERTPFER